MLTFCLCPEHNKSLIEDFMHSEYGPHMKCPILGCSVEHWKDSKSTPADENLRNWRMKAHERLDSLWKDTSVRRCSRPTVYYNLARVMHLSKRDCHIGLFSVGQCKSVILFVTQIRNGKIEMKNILWGKSSYISHSKRKVVRN